MFLHNLGAAARRPLSAHLPLWCRLQIVRLNGPNKRIRFFRFPILAAYVLRHPKPVSGAASSGGKNGGVERATRGVRKELLCYVKRTKNCASPLTTFCRLDRTCVLPYDQTMRVSTFKWDYRDSSFRAKAAAMCVVEAGVRVCGCVGLSVRKLNHMFF